MVGSEPLITGGMQESWKPFGGYIFKEIQENMVG